MKMPEMPEGLGLGDDTNFKILATGGAMGAAFVARKAVTSSWRLVTGSEPPVNPEDPDVTWKEAVAWALLSGAAIGLARLIASRQAAAWFRSSTGRLPGNLQKSSA